MPDNEEQTPKPKPSIHDNPLDGLADRINDAQQATDKMWSRNVTEAQTFPDGGSIAHVSEATDDWGKPYTSDVREAKDALKATQPDWDTGKGNPDLNDLNAEDLKRLMQAQAGAIADPVTSDLSGAPTFTNDEGEAVDPFSEEVADLIRRADAVGRGEEDASDDE